MMDMKTQLQQYPAFRGCCAFLSNFALYLEQEYLIEGGITYKSNEHYYQAKKFTRRVDKLLIAGHPKFGLKQTVREMAARGLQRADWDKVKEQVMMEGLRHKFKQQRFLYLLRTTGKLELVERNTWGDTFWGVCNGKGDNRLGKMLMEIRAKDAAL